MRLIKQNLASLRVYMHRTSLLGVSSQRALLWELPLLVLKRAYARVATSIYSLVNQRKLIDGSITRRLHRLSSADRPLFYVIVMPGVLHLLTPAVKLVHHHCQLVFVFNGISVPEKEGLREQFPHIPAIALWTLPGVSWPHGHLLSILLRTSEKDFGILDHDFFLFEPSALDQLTFDGNEFAICASCWRNRVTGQEFPLTHLLYLRVAPLRDLMQYHGVDARMYKKIPRQLSDDLKAMGLTMDNPPKDYQTFFDSFQLLAALALQEGRTLRKLELHPEGSIHIGGTSIGLPVSKSSSHHYLYAKFLERYPHPVSGSRYCPLGFNSRRTPEQLRATVQPEIADRVDALLKRLETHSYS